MVRSTLVILCNSIVFCVVASAQQSPVAGVDAGNLPQECYLFTSFRNNGEDGLRFVAIVDTCLDGERRDDLQTGTWVRAPGP